MKCKIRNARNKFIVITFIFLILFLSINQYNNSVRNFKQTYNNNQGSLRSSFTFTFNETFQTLTYINESITNSTGWGKDFLFLPHQEVNNLSSYNYNFDVINTIRSDGNLQILADNSRGLKILNISNPTSPTLISQFGDSYNLTLDITIKGKYAYTADGADGMEIIDISNPNSLQKINSWSNGYNITNVLISDGLAFLSVQDVGIEILNITNPHSLIKVGNWSNNRSPSNVGVKDHHLFTASDNFKLEILNITELNNIVKVGEFPIINKPHQIRIKDDYVYLANGIEGLKVLEVKNVSNPSLISSLNQDGSITNIVIRENYAFLANNTYGLSIVDLLNPINPKLIHHWDLNEKITSVEVYGDFIYIGCKSSGLKILKLSELINPRKLYDYSPNINARKVIIDDTKAYLCSVEDGTYEGGFSIYDINDPFNPQNLGNFSKSGFDFYDIDIDGEIGFAATYENGLISLNISDPKNINILDSVGGYLLNFSQNIEIYNNYALVTNGLLGLDIYDISDPLNVTHIANYPGDLSSVGVYSDVKIRNDCAFIAKGYEGIEIFNISDLHNIRSIANYSDSYNNSQALAFWGNYLLVADRFDGLEILDVSDLANPQKISQYTDAYNRATYIDVVDNLAIVSDRTDGIEIINISNPLDPVEVASYSDSYNNTWGCAATNRILYIADAYDGLQVVQYREHLFNQYEKRAIAQSLEIDKTIATITNATMTIDGEIPIDTTIQSFLSNDNGNNWDSVINNTFHSFSTIGSELIWKVIITTTNDLFSPKIFSININYSAINTPPMILNPTELQNLAVWNQLEDFGFFELDLSSYKDDNEFSAEYLYWSIINLDTSLVTFIQDSVNKDLFRFYSVDDVYGNDGFELILEDEAGASISLNISITINSVNDAPFFIENNINIEQVSTLDTINIEYEADDVDNLLSELNFSIYYGAGNNWYLLVEDYKDTTYTWETGNVPNGNYYIKIVVSDGLDNSTWISPDSYSIMHESPLLNPLTIGLIAGGGIGIVIVVALIIRARKRKKEPLPIAEDEA